MVECLIINACCCFVIRPAASNDEQRMSLIIDSINFQAVDVKEIGL